MTTVLKLLNEGFHGAHQDLDKMGLLDQQVRDWRAHDDRGMVSAMDRNTYSHGVDTHWMLDALMVEQLAWFTALGPSRCIVYKTIYDRFSNASSNTANFPYWGNVFRLKSSQEEIDNQVYLDPGRAMMEIYSAYYDVQFRLIYDYDPNGTSLYGYNYGLGSFDENEKKSTLYQYYWGYPNRMSSSSYRYGWFLNVAWSDDPGKEYFAWSAHQTSPSQVGPQMPMGGIIFRLKNPNLTVDNKYGVGWGYLPAGLYEEAVSLNYSDGIPDYWSPIDGSPRPGYENTENWKSLYENHDARYPHKFEKARGLRLIDHRLQDNDNLRTGVYAGGIVGDTSLSQLAHDAQPSRLYRNAPVNLYLNEVAGYTNDNMIVMPKNAHREGSALYGRKFYKVGSEDYFRFGGTLMKIS